MAVRVLTTKFADYREFFRKKKEQARLARSAAAQQEQQQLQGVTRPAPQGPPAAGSHTQPHTRHAVLPAPPNVTNSTGLASSRQSPQQPALPPQAAATSVVIPVYDESDPKWVTLSSTLQSDLDRIDELMQKLRGLHTEALRVSFETDSKAQETDHSVEILTQQISSLFRKAQADLTAIAGGGGGSGGGGPNNKQQPSERLTRHERALRLNLMRSAGGALRERSQAFRAMQKQYLTRARSQELVQESFFQALEANPGLPQPTFEELQSALDGGLSSEQLQALNELEERSSRREKMIVQVCRSIHELASLFAELDMLIVEQGSIVDRIDYNVEQLLTHVKVANVELKEANAQQKANTWRANACLVVLVGAVGLLIYFVVAKYE